jgi:pyruvate carboxylase
VQGSLGAVVAATQGTELDTGLDLTQVSKLSVFWEQTRELYSPYESTLRASSADVYYHEMPGGQYTNLKFQSLSLGAGSGTMHARGCSVWKESRVAAERFSRRRGPGETITSTVAFH